jgi:hypothetical protein
MTCSIPCLLPLIPMNPLDSWTATVLRQRLMEETAMTATKAIAGGVAANIVTVILWAISNVPGWAAVPDQPKAAIIGLVSAGVGAAIVYFAPANKQTLAATASERSGDLGPAFPSRTILAGTSD